MASELGQYIRDLKEVDYWAAPIDARDDIRGIEP